MAAVGIILSIPLLFIVADPLSNFGRGVASLAGLAAGAMYPIGYLHIAALAAVAALALARGRRFCDWCPAGVALGLASRAAPFGMRLDETRCVSCGACERSCPMNCADAAGKKIDASRCVLCAGCAAACPGGHIRFGYRRSYRNIPGRRNFVKYAGSLIISACYFGGGNLREFVGITAREAEGGLILPPGARSESHFLSRCVGCQACVKVCPVSVIKQAGARPRIVYGEAYCQYSCTECGALCPTGAIERLSLEEKRRTRVALSELDLSGCVVMTKRQACGACAEVCPTRALHMEPYGGEGAGLSIPVFDEEYCIGCGACLCVCPAEPNAFAINPVPSQTMTPGLRVAPEGAGGAGSVRPMTKDDDFPF
jgi:ferredoxin